MKIEVGQIITLDIGPKIRVYRVTGVYLGSSKEENVIGLKCLDMKPSPEVHMRTNDEMLVPQCFVELVMCQNGKLTLPPLDIQKIAQFGKDEYVPHVITKEFVWFDTTNHIFHEIDKNVTGPDGEPYPPIGCIKVKKGTEIKIFINLFSGKKHICIGGRALKEDNTLGLYCIADFENGYYALYNKFKAELAVITKPVPPPCRSIRESDDKPLCLKLGRLI